jgi:hypothetical protein
VSTRKILTILAMTVIVAGCGGEEAGPTPSGGNQDTSPNVLAVKLRALAVDDCFTSPATQTPKGCQKFVTELGSTSGMVRQAAGTRHPDLVGLANNLDKAIASYRGPHCETATTPGNPCSQALTDISNTLRDIEQIVNTQLATS